MSTAVLAKKLGHEFSDKNLLRTALTHRSYGTPNNERLEFLGDGVLNFAIAAALFKRFPELPEGDLSRLRANLVRQDALHQLALSLDIGNLLRLGEGEMKSGGSQRPSILADALEALLPFIFSMASSNSGMLRGLKITNKGFIATAITNVYVGKVVFYDFAIFVYCKLDIKNKIIK